MSASLPPPGVVEDDVARALAEDIGSGDVTAALLPDAPEIAYLLCKEQAVVCGRPWFDACHRTLDPAVRLDWRVAEGDRVEPGTVLATLQGRSRVAAADVLGQRARDIVFDHLGRRRQRIHAEGKSATCPVAMPSSTSSTGMPSSIR